MEKLITIMEVVQHTFCKDTVKECKYENLTVGYLKVIL